MDPEELERQVAAAAAELAAAPEVTAVTVPCQVAENGKPGCKSQFYVSGPDGMEAAHRAAALLRRHVASHWN